ncbi:hypothetical protein [Neoroseomonas soli]|uniref:hypothetical protein n=1 Tax=Neoroseomonas soli TaxID=1081025 RepID=UPI001BA8ECDC|nr:hypothetical protein [Neoroseomonas soli]
MGDVVHFRRSAMPWPDRAKELDRTAEFVLRRGLRPWVNAMRCGVDPLPEVRATIAEAGGPADVALSVNALMYGVAMQSLREVVIGCPHCERLSPDEALLLYAIAEAAAGADRPAEALAPFMRAVALTWLDFPLIDLSRGLGAAGWRFRRRALPGPAEPPRDA